MTAELRKRLPDGKLIAVDGSEAMIAKARERLGEGVTYVVADLAELELADPVDLVFSTATLHWITDHERLFERLRAVLAPGGRLVAQCGGQGNVAEHAAVIAEVSALPEYSPVSGRRCSRLELRRSRGDRAPADRIGLQRGGLLARAETGEA